MRVYSKVNHFLEDGQLQFTAYAKLWHLCWPAHWGDMMLLWLGGWFWYHLSVMFSCRHRVTSVLWRLASPDCPRCSITLQFIWQTQHLLFIFSQRSVMSLWKTNCEHQNNKFCPNSLWNVRQLQIELGNSATMGVSKLVTQRNWWGLLIEVS